jgi:hypothetical protein
MARATTHFSPELTRRLRELEDLILWGMETGDPCYACSACDAGEAEYCLTR